MMTPVRPSYAGHRFPAEVISHAVWLYFRFPLSLRMLEEMLAARGILVSHETIRQWALKFGQDFANQIRRRLPAAGDKLRLAADAGAVLAALDAAPPDALAAARPIISDDGERIVLALHHEAGALASVVLPPRHALTLASDLIAAALRRL